MGTMLALLLNEKASRYAKTGVDKNAEPIFSESATTIRCRVQKNRTRIVKGTEILYQTVLTIEVEVGVLVVGDKVLYGGVNYTAEACFDYGSFTSLEGENFILKQLSV